MGLIKVIDEDGVEEDIDAEVGASFMAILRDNDYDIPAICGGASSCGTCHVWVNEKWFDKLPIKDDEENYLLETLDDFNEKKSRLACQIEYADDLDGISILLLENN